jgi:hypothetical protein
MFQTSQLFTGSSEEVAVRMQNPDGAWLAQATAGAAQGHAGKPSRDAEEVVAEMVKQYFRCSTQMSGAFLCW